MACALHAQVIADDGPLETQARAQDVLQPPARKARRAAVHLGVDHMCGHDGGKRAAQPGIGRSVVLQNGLEAAPIHRNVGVRIGPHKAVPREMLAAVGHARLQQTMRQALGQHRHHARVGMEGTVTDHTAATPVQVQHGCEGKIDAASPQLTGQHIARRCGRIGGRHGPAARAGFAVLHPQCAQGAHGWQLGETVGAKALHAAALVVHADEQVLAHGLDRAGELQQLRTVAPVAGEQDDAPGERVRKAPAVVCTELRARHVQQEGGMDRHAFSPFICYYFDSCLRLFHKRHRPVRLHKNWRRSRFHRSRSGGHATTVPRTTHARPRAAR